MDKHQRYLSYLLRLWQAPDAGKLVWRASLEVPGSGERLNFISLDELESFLEQETEGKKRELKYVKREA